MNSRIPIPVALFILSILLGAGFFIAFPLSLWTVPGILPFALGNIPLLTCLLISSIVAGAAALAVTLIGLRGTRSENAVHTARWQFIVLVVLSSAMVVFIFLFALLPGGGAGFFPRLAAVLALCSLSACAVLSLFIFIRGVLRVVIRKSAYAREWRPLATGYLFFIIPFLAIAGFVVITFAKA